MFVRCRNKPTSMRSSAFGMTLRQAYWLRAHSGLALQLKYPGLECHVLRLPSVASILAGEPAPPPCITIASWPRDQDRL
jgi:hypothetical protein